MHPNNQSLTIYASIFNEYQSLLQRLKPNYIVFFAVLTLVITRIGVLSLTFHLGPYADEDNYISRGIGFLYMISPQPGRSYVDYLEQFYYHGYWPPLYSIILSPIYSYFEYEGVRSFLVLLDIVTGILFYILASKIITKSASILALYLYAVNPFLLVASFSILSEGLFNIFVIGFLLTYVKLLEPEKSKVRTNLLFLLLGLLMAGALLIRSAFILVFVIVAVVTIVRFWKNWRFLRLFFVSAFIMLCLTLPWNLLIKKQEGKYLFMHTISAQQLYMKFIDRAGGWNTVQEKLQRQATEQNKSYQDLATNETRTYFANLTSVWMPLNIMIHDFRNDYLMGPAEHEQRLRLGLYDSTAYKDQILWYGLVAHELFRLPIILFGTAGLIFFIGRFKYRDIFIAASLGTAAVGIIGLTWGRHLVNLMPFLTLGAAAALIELRKIPKGYFLFASLGAFGIALLGFNAWQTKNSGYWTSTYENKLVEIGKPYNIVDSIQLRKLDGCTDSLILDKDEQNWSISVKSLRASNSSFEEVKPLQEILVDDFVLLDIRPKSLNKNSKTIKYVVNGKPSEMPLNTGRVLPDWSQSLPNSCVRFKH